MINVKEIGCVCYWGCVASSLLNKLPSASVADQFSSRWVGTLSSSRLPASVTCCISKSFSPIRKPRRCKGILIGFLLEKFQFYINFLSPSHPQSASWTHIKHSGLERLQCPSSCRSQWSLVSSTVLFFICTIHQTFVFQLSKL